MVQLALQRREPALVRRDESGGWLQQFRQGTLVTPTLRTPPWSHYVAVNDAFCWAYRPAAGDTVLELGAGTGTETVLLSRLVGAQGRVVACEAHPDTARLLRRALACNAVSNATVLEVAIADQTGHVSMTDEHGASSIANTVGTGGTLQVASMTLDDLLAAASVDAVDLMKVNIEGAERSLVNHAATPGIGSRTL